jgi:hypothetical protein
VSEKLLDIKTARFYGKLFFRCPLPKGCSKNCVYDLGLKWYILITNYIGCFSRRPIWGLREKLLDIKTARFYGKVFFRCESYRFTSKKLKSFLWIFTET